MSLPGIRPIALDDRSGAWYDHVSDDGSSPQQQKQHSTLRLDEASPDRPSRGQTHAQQFRPNRRPPGAQYAHNNDSGGGTSNGRLKRSKPVKWSMEEDRRLREAVNKFDEARWKDIANQVETRNHVQCLQRWKKVDAAMLTRDVTEECLALCQVLKPGLVKGQWSPEEDDRLVSLVERGYRNWGQVASYMEGRTSKQCRERWCHHLDPAVRKGGYTAEEDDLIVYLQDLLGNRWADIAKRLTGRTENAVKIRWKALNRRQRDARNKAAAAAASAATGGSSGMSTSNSTRTGGREAARTAGRTATARSVAARETPSRRSASVKDGVISESGSRQEAWLRGLKSLPPASDTRSTSVTALPQSNSAAVQSTEVDDSRQPGATDEEQHVRVRVASAVSGALQSPAMASDLESAHHGSRAVSSLDWATDASGGEMSDVDAGVTERTGEQEAQFPEHMRAPHPAEEEGLQRLCAALRNVEAMSCLKESPEQSPSSTTTTAACDERPRSSSKQGYRSSSRVPPSPGHEARNEGWSDPDCGEQSSPSGQPYEEGSTRSMASPPRTLPPPVGSTAAVTKQNPVRLSPRAIPMTMSSFARESTETAFSIAGVHRSVASSESKVVRVPQTRMNSPRRAASSPLTMAVEVWTGLPRPGVPSGNGPEVMAEAAAVASAAAARPRAIEAEDSRILAQEAQLWLKRREELQMESIDATPAVASHLGFSSRGFIHDARHYARTTAVVKEDPAFVVDDASVVVSMKHSRSRNIAPDKRLLERPSKKACRSSM